MRSIQLVVLMALSIIVSACSDIVGDTGLIHDRSNQYLKSRNGQRLVVPTHLDNDKISDYYVIHPSEGQPGVIPLPPGSLVAKMAQNDIRARQPLPADAITMVAENKQEPRMVIDQSSSEALITLAGAAKKRDIPVLSLDRNQGTVTILDTFQTFDRVNSNTPNFVLRVAAKANKSQVVIRDLNNKPINPETAKRLLADLEQGAHGIQKSSGIAGWIKRKLS